LNLLNENHLKKALFVGGLIGLSYGVNNALITFLSKAHFFQFSKDLLQMSSLIFLTSGLGAGLSYWVLIGLFNGLSSNRLDEHDYVVPNQGIRRSLRNGFYIGIISGFICWSLSYLLFQLSSVLLTIPSGLPRPDSDRIYLLNSLTAGLAGGLLMGLLSGGRACIQHYVLRFLLWRKLPYILDNADKRILLRRVGGGYIFVHRLLQEYFASLDVQSVAMMVREQAQGRQYALS
jgi:hypothetical protein